MEKTQKPILFNPQMVAAILNKNPALAKCCTRRLLKLPVEYKDWNIVGFVPYAGTTLDENGSASIQIVNPEHNSTTVVSCKPAYQVGDILYVRERWTPLGKDEYGKYRIRYSDSDERQFDIEPLVSRGREGKCHPSIHMPKAIARIYLRVTGVSVSHLQSITASDIRKEGINSCDACIRSVSDCLLSTHNFCRWEQSDRKAFASLWDSTIQESGLSTCGWNANPIVWAYTFQLINKEDV